MSELNKENITSWKKPYGKGKKLGPNGLEDGFANVMKQYTVGKAGNFIYKVRDNGTGLNAFIHLENAKHEALLHSVPTEMNLLQISMYLQTGVAQEFIIKANQYFLEEQWEGHEIILKAVNYKGHYAWHQEGESTKPIIFILGYQVTPNKDRLYRKRLWDLWDLMTTVDSRSLVSHMQKGIDVLRSVLFNNAALMSEDLKEDIMKSSNLPSWWKSTPGVFLSFITPQAILLDTPLVPTCGRCGGKGTLSCPCKKILFCSKECQKEKWQEGHKKECSSAAQPTKPVKTPSEPTTSKEGDGLTANNINPLTITPEEMHFRFQRAYKDEENDLGLELRKRMNLHEIMAAENSNVQIGVKNIFVTFCTALKMKMKGVALMAREADVSDYLSITFIPYDDHLILMKGNAWDSDPLIFIQCTVMNGRRPTSSSSSILACENPVNAMSLALNILKRNACQISQPLREKLERSLSMPSKQKQSFISFVSPLGKTVVDPREVQTCVLCQKPKGGVCQRCQAVRYCGRSCQKEDWIKGHKLVCFKSF